MAATSARRVLLQECPAIHRRVDVAHQIENGGQRHRGIEVVGEAGVEILLRLSSGAF